MIAIILLIIIGVSVILIIVIVGRNFSKLSSIDTASVPEVRQAVLKDKIIIDRLKRKFLGGTKKFILFSQPLYFILKKKIDEIHNKVLEIESFYEKEKRKEFFKKGGHRKLREKIIGLFAKIKELLKSNKWDEIEKKYIEVIKLDPKNLTAYKGLGELYLKQKKYKEAKEILEYVLKIENYESAPSYIDLGLVFKLWGKHEEALDNFKKAVKLEPHNPKNLDLLLEESLEVGDKDLAQETYNKLKTVNPENQKLEDFKKRIEELT